MTNRIQNGAFSLEPWKGESSPNLSTVKKFGILELDNHSTANASPDIARSVDKFSPS